MTSSLIKHQVRLCPRRVSLEIPGISAQNQVHHLQALLPRPITTCPNHHGPQLYESRESRHASYPQSLPQDLCLGSHGLLPVLDSLDREQLIQTILEYDKVLLLRGLTMPPEHPKYPP